MRASLPWIVATVCAIVGTPAAAQQNPDQLAVPFSDPSRPGTVEVHTMRGDITIRSTGRKDVLIETRPRSEVFGRSQSAPPPGLRRLTQAAGFSIEEDNNHLSVRSSAMNRGVDFVIEIPIRTNLQLSTMNGSITVEGADGELEANSMNGPVTLTNVAGSVVAHSMNGMVRATLTRLTADKAMSFTSMNGTIDVTLPASVKANLKLRSDRGDVYTDFDLQLASQPPAAVTDEPGGRRRGQGRAQGRFRIEINKAIHGTVNGGGPDLEMRTFNGEVYVRKGP